MEYITQKQFITAQSLATRDAEKFRLRKVWDYASHYWDKKRVSVETWQKAETLLRTLTRYNNATERELELDSDFGTSGSHEHKRVLAQQKRLGALLEKRAKELGLRVDYGTFARIER